MSYLFKTILFLSFACAPLYFANAEDNSQSLAEVNSLIESKAFEREELEVWLDNAKKTLRKEESERSIIRLNLRKLELNVKRLKMLAPDKDGFDTKNEIIGLNYEIDSHKKRLVELNAALEESRKKQKIETARLGVLISDIEKLKAQQVGLAELQTMETQQMVKQQSDQQEQKRVSDQQAERENAELEEQERINAMKRKVIASQTRLPETTTETTVETISNNAQSSNSVADVMKASEQQLAAPAVPTPAVPIPPTAPKEFDVKLAQAKLIDEARTLRPAAAALNYAEARALEPMSEAPVFGDQIELSTSLPPGSKPQGMGLMRHIGNNQYKLEIPVQKGKQEFVVGKHRFFKMVPKQFHNSLCLILIDARNKAQPGFQLLNID